MLIGGAAMTLIGIAILMVEAGRARPVRGRGEQLRVILWLRRVALTGGLLIGLMVFSVEFDFGVPQFRMVFGPMLVMLAAGVAPRRPRGCGSDAAPRSAPSPSSCSSAASCR